MLIQGSVDRNEMLLASPAPAAVVSGADLPTAAPDSFSVLIGIGQAITELPKLSLTEGRVRKEKDGDTQDRKSGGFEIEPSQGLAQTSPVVMDHVQQLAHIQGVAIPPPPLEMQQAPSGSPMQQGVAASQTTTAVVLSRLENSGGLPLGALLNDGRVASAIKAIRLATSLATPAQQPAEALPSPPETSLTMSSVGAHPVTTREGDAKIPTIQEDISNDAVSQGWRATNGVLTGTLDRSAQQAGGTTTQMARTLSAARALEPNPQLISLSQTPAAQSLPDTTQLHKWFDLAGTLQTARDFSANLNRRSDMERTVAVLDNPSTVRGHADEETMPSSTTNPNEGSRPEVTPAATIDPTYLQADSASGTGAPFTDPGPRRQREYQPTPRASLVRDETSAMILDSSSASPRQSGAAVHPGPIAFTPGEIAYSAQLALPKTADPRAVRALGSLMRSDLQIGLQTEAFGRVTIYTVNEGGQLTAHLSLENERGSASLAAQLPEAERRIQHQYGLDASVSMSHRGSGYEQGASAGGQRQQDAPSPSGVRGRRPGAGNLPYSSPDIMHVHLGLAQRDGRLDVRA